MDWMDVGRRVAIGVAGEKDTGAAAPNADPQRGQITGGWHAPTCPGRREH